MVTGLDLVRIQLQVAAGEALPLAQEDVHHRGAAIELRVVAEDPFASFAPSAGTVRGLQIPGGAYTRVDTALEEGTEVSLFYDALLAKLIVWDETRPLAIQRLVRAASEFHLSGVRTTLPLIEPLSRDPDYLAGRFHVTWLDGFVARAAAEVPRSLETAALVAALAAHRDSRRGLATARDERAGPRQSPWALAGRPRP